MTEWRPKETQGAREVTDEVIAATREQVERMTHEERLAHVETLRARLGMSDVVLKQAQRLMRIEQQCIKENLENGGATGDIDQGALDAFMAYLWINMRSELDSSKVSLEEIFRAVFAMGIDVGIKWGEGYGLEVD